MTELFFETKQPAMAERMKKEGAEFLARVPHGPENVFLEWSGEYGARLDRQEPPQTSLTGKDYVACSAMLLLIRDGDKMEKYTRAELKYLMGG
jgi:hypothetical protein